MVSKKCFHQMHRCLIVIFDFPNFQFSVRSMLAVGDFHQYHSVYAMPVYVTSLDLN